MLVWICFLYITVRKLAETVTGPSKWGAGDWLINYADGPVRRGMFGEIIRWLAALGLDPYWVLPGLQLLIYLALFAIVLELFLSMSRPKEWFLFFASPVFLTFPVRDFSGAFRKEILGLLAMAVLARVLFRDGTRWAGLAVAGVLFTVAAFSHEANAMMAPFILHQLWAAHRLDRLSRSQAIAAAGGTVVISGAAIGLALLYQGDFAQAQQICKSVIQMGFEYKVCTGGIMALGREMWFFMQYVHMNLPQYLATYGIALVLVLMPLFVFRAWYRELAIALAYLAVFSPLYFVGMDWGRWIYVPMSAYILRLLWLSRFQPLPMRRIPEGLIFLYVIMWAIPHSCPGDCVYRLQTFNTFRPKEIVWDVVVDDWLENGSRTP